MDEVNEWLGPFQAEELLFVNDVNDQKVIIREYIESQFYFGGDECGTVNPYHIINYYTKQDNLVILQTSAYRFEVIIKAVDDTIPFGNELLIIEYKNKVTLRSKIGLILSDTTISFIDRVLLKIENTEDEESINFKELNFVQGIGIVSFVDKLSVKWKLKSN